MRRVGANPAANLAETFRQVNGKPLSASLMVTAIAGLKRAYPEAGIDEYLNPAGKALLATAEDETLIEEF